MFICTFLPFAWYMDALPMLLTQSSRPVAMFSYASISSSSNAVVARALLLSISVIRSCRAPTRSPMKKIIDLCL